jgi:hypothetical protein
MWGPWAVGMASDPLAAKHLEQIGLAVIPPALGLRALSLHLRLAHTHTHPEVSTPFPSWKLRERACAMLAQVVWL